MSVEEITRDEAVRVVRRKDAKKNVTLADLKRAVTAAFQATPSDDAFRTAMVAFLDALDEKGQ